MFSFLLPFRLEWAVEEREHMRVVKEGWVHKKSSRKVHNKYKNSYSKVPCSYEVSAIGKFALSFVRNN